MNGVLKCICVGDLGARPASGHSLRQHFSVSATHSRDSARPRKQPDVIAMSHLHHHQSTLFLYLMPQFKKKEEEANNCTLSQSGSPGLSFSQLLNMYTHPVPGDPAPSCRSQLTGVFTQTIFS